MSENQAEAVPLDPRAEAVRDSIIHLLNSAQGIWKDALDSQVRLTECADQLQTEMTEIRQYSALPTYPSGMKLLQSSLNRIQVCKKRITAVGGRLNRIAATLERQRLMREKNAEAERRRQEIAAKREKIYAMLINLIEDYNVKLLSTKVYWETPSKREEYKAFWNKYKEISKLKENDFIEYIKQKEILFIKNDIKNIKNSKIDYSKLIKYYKRKLVDYGVMKEIRNSYKSEGKFLKVKSKEVA